ncbi:MAG TPA: DEAD/DEAH box helicase [Polyangiaceae bacterium]|jgi:superfamily II DNA or RNA helicase|nr:DEAD/DEAH box helicase [Polyangiaceae bacterium]
MRRHEQSVVSARAEPHATASERFASSTVGWSDDDLKLVAAIALEQSLARPALKRLFPPGGAALDAALARAAEAGLIVRSRPMPSILFAAAMSDEASFAVHPEYEQLVLRELHARGMLRDVARALRDELGARSIADIPLALQDGDLERFTRALAVRRLRDGPERTAAEWLRLTVCEPFDAEWFTRLFGGAVWTLGARILRASLEGPAPCDALLDWVKARVADVESDADRVAIASALHQHALFRGTPPGTVVGLPAEVALGLEVAQRFAASDLAAAERALDEALAARGRGRKPALRLDAAAPIAALLLAARDDAESRAEALRLARGWTGEGEKSAARAFRTLLKYLELPEGTHPRIDAHQLAAGAGTWEILLSAYTVALHLDAPTTRASWAVLVARKAVEWRGMGYHWLARQALFLAQELSPVYAQQALTELRVDPAAWSGERALSLWHLLTPKAEWKRTLDALAAVSDAVVPRDEVAQRALWYVDMVTGALGRPALQEYRADEGGWTTGRRLALAELHEARRGLPPEDLRVLACTRETHDAKRDFTNEAYEALIDHPRVVDGARARTPIKVVRGQCRIETEEDAGYVRVVVEPEGAVLGVNVVPTGEDELVVYRVTPAMARVIEVLPHGVRVPKAEEPALVRVLRKLSRSVEVRSPVLGAESEATADATPCVRIAPYAGAWLVQLGVRPFGAQGRFFVAGIGRVSVTHASEGVRLRTERNFDAELAGVAALIAECPTLIRDEDEQSEAEAAGEAHGYTFGEQSLLGLLSELRDARTRHELEWPESSPLRLAGKVSSAALHARLRVTKGWYLVTGGVRLSEVNEVALRELVRAPALAGGRFVRLPGGDYVEVEERVRRVMAALAAARHDRRPGAELRVHPGAIGTLKELTAPENGLAVDDEAKEWLARVENLSSKSFPVPETLRAELRSYQHDGYVWLCRLAELGLGACLADDMGLGKTVQIIALLLARATDGPALVVAPTSVCSNWGRELARFAPSLTVVDYTGPDRRGALDAALAYGAGKVVVTSYALLQQDEEVLTSIEWGTAVLDEAQFIKNAKSRRALAAFRLVASRRIAATGTPVENHFGDLFSIFRFLNPGLLGEWPEFNRTYIEPVERGGLLDPENALRALVRPYVLRRLKRDVLSELPPLTEVQHDVHLSKDEAMRYALLRRQVHDKLFTVHGKRQNKIQALAEITRLRRFCCHPRLVFPDADPDSSKIRVFVELVSELRESERRALVFSQYVDFLGIVRETLDELGISYEYLDGSTPLQARQDRVDAFQNGSATLFLISLKAGGFGLNLTGADTVVHLDPWWNPAVEAQATDRSHRIGQERPVTVYRLVTKNTIEEKIVELHEKKQRLARALLEGTEEPASLGVDELLALIEGKGPEESHL